MDARDMERRRTTCGQILQAAGILPDEVPAVLLCNHCARPVAVCPRADVARTPAQLAAIARVADELDVPLVADLAAEVHCPECCTRDDHDEED